MNPAPIDTIADQFNAIITAVVTDGSGVHWYQWTEQSFNASTGQFTTFVNARTGTYDPTVPQGENAALELNNASVSVGAYVRLKYRGNLNGVQLFDFLAPSGTSPPPPPPPAQCTGCGWIAALYGSPNPCLSVSLNGSGTGLTLSSTDGGTWTNDTATVTICGHTYEVTLTLSPCALPCLTLTGVGSGAGNYTGTLDCCACGYIVFAFSTAALCGTEATGVACNDITKIRLDQSCCDTIAGWGGAGWYCAMDTASPTLCVPVDLTAADACDDTITICSGPYPDEPTASAACAGIPGCEENPPSNPPRVARITAATGTCTCLDPGPYTGVLAGGGSYWTWTFTGPAPCSALGITMNLSCNGQNQYAYTQAGTDTIISWNPTTNTVVVRATNLSCDNTFPLTSTFEVTFTDT